MEQQKFEQAVREAQAKYPICGDKPIPGRYLMEYLMELNRICKGLESQE